MSDQIAFIFNPASKNSIQVLEKYDLEHWAFKNFPQALWLKTQKPKHASQLAQKYAEEGVRKFVAIGGDGTLSEVAHGLMMAQCEKTPTLGLIASGTGCDFSRHLRSEYKPFRGVEWLKKTKTLKIDMGLLTLVKKGKKTQRYFINITHLGMGGDVTRIVNESKKKWGRLSYAAAIIEGIKSYEPFVAEIEIDERKIEARLMMFLVANGPYFGGGMKIAPAAKLDDGIFHSVFMREVSKFTLLKHLPAELTRLFMGRPMSSPMIHYDTLKKAKVKALDGRSFYIDIDGETDRVEEIHFEIVPKALPILLPK